MRTTQKMIIDNEPLLPQLDCDNGGIKTENMSGWVRNMFERLPQDLSEDLELDPER